MQYCALKYKHPSVFTKLRWFGHVVRSIGICKTILQGTVPGKNKSFSFSRVQELPFRLVSFNISEYHPLHVFLISPSSASVLHLFSFKHMLPVMSYGRLFLVCANLYCQLCYPFWDRCHWQTRTYNLLH